MTLVTQADFAKRKSVTRAAVSQWKREGRLIFSGKLVDLEATESAMIATSRHHSKRRIPAAPGVKRATESVNRMASLNTEPAAYTDGAVYDNPANLPDQVVDASAAIGAGAVDMARLAGRHLSLAIVRPLVEEWVRRQRRGFLGGPGLQGSIADEEWPDPPLGYAHWRDHPLFSKAAISEPEWSDVEDVLNSKP